MKELILAIKDKNQKEGFCLNPPVTLQQIETFQKKIDFNLPHDFIEFYLICNGFECEDDIFNFKKLEDIMEYREHYGKDWFDFAEYMIHSDMWALKRTEKGDYQITNNDTVLTSSLYEFLEIFLKGNVFDEGGLYDRIGLK